MEFDKGARGKGFATYDPSGNVIEQYDTKEDAYVKFTNWVTVAEQVLSLIAARPVEQVKETAKKPAQKPAA
jgi:hypothetical protein